MTPLKDKIDLVNRLFAMSRRATPAQRGNLARSRLGLLALGNFAFHRWDCETLLRAGVGDILQPDVCWAGGITECRRILEMAATAGVKVILHNTCEQPWALSLAAADADMDVVEHVDRGETSLLYALLETPAEFVSGQVRLPHSVTGNTPQSQIETMLVA